jgi:hypothetical protein
MGGKPMGGKPYCKPMGGKPYGKPLFSTCDLFM